MGLKDKFTPHMKNALLEVPVAHRQEVSDALADEFDFELWRVEQDPVVEDTPANRANFIADVQASRLFNHIRRIVRKARGAAAAQGVETDLDS
jgi:hypothetical protein